MKANSSVIGLAWFPLITCTKLPIGSTLLTLLVAPQLWSVWFVVKIRPTWSSDNQNPPTNLPEVCQQSKARKICLMHHPHDEPNWGSSSMQSPYSRPHGWICVCLWPLWPLFIRCFFAGAQCTRFGWAVAGACSSSQHSLFPASLSPDSKTRPPTRRAALCITKCPT